MSEAIFKDRPAPELAGDSLSGAPLTTAGFLRRILNDHLRRRWGLLALCLIALGFTALTTGSLPFLIQLAADEVFLRQNRVLLVVLPAVVIAITVLKAVSEYVGNVSQAYLGNRIVADLRVRMFEAITQADLAWLQRTHSGRFVSTFLNDVNVIRAAAVGTLIGIGENSLKVIVLTATMLWMDWRLASLALLAMPVGFSLMGRQRRRMRVSVSHSLQQTGDLGQIVAQALNGIRVIKAYRQEAQETARARAVIDHTFDSVMNSARAHSASGPMTEVLTGVGFAAAVLYGGWQGMRGAVSPGEFMGFMTAAMLMYQPLKALAQLQTSLQEGVSAAARIFAITDRKPTIREQPDARPLVVTRGEIVFDEVSFAYGSDQPVLSKFSLTVPAGAKVALVGPSGSGKTTAMNLVLRFFDPIEGRVLIDGQDIAKATLSSVRRVSALLTQDPVLFDETVRANIAYGSEGIDLRRIEEAAEAAAAHDFIRRLPEGYDTRVGEAGGRLSGGERQRIAIARALLRDAPILLLDEPTSALDSHAEAHVQAALDRLFKGRTVLMIAHRLSTVKQADLIAVMDRGQVVELGRHEELLARGGRYAALYRTQFAENTGLPSAAE